MMRALSMATGTPVDFGQIKRRGGEELQRRRGVKAQGRTRAGEPGRAAEARRRGGDLATGQLGDREIDR